MCNLCRNFNHATYFIEFIYKKSYFKYYIKIKKMSIAINKEFLIIFYKK